MKEKVLQMELLNHGQNHNYLYYAQTLASIAKHYGFSLDEKWKKLPKKIKDVILIWF